MSEEQEMLDSHVDRKTVTNLSIFLVIFASSIKFIMVFFTKSLSYTAEFIDSIIDITAVFITFLALRESEKPADFKHMYGHEKINSFAALFQGQLILGMYGYILYSAIRQLFSVGDYQTENTQMAAYSLLIIVVVVFIVSQKIINIGKKTQNSLIIAQGVNFRGDFYRNITVIVGLIVVSFGYNLIDLLLALIFSLISIYGAFQVIVQSFNELTDANVITHDDIEKLEFNIKKIPNVKTVDLKIRTVARNLDAIINIFAERTPTGRHTNRITREVEGIVENQFNSFSCNTYIVFQSGRKRTSSFDDTGSSILTIIKNTSALTPNVQNVHNITVEFFGDGVLLQYHIDFNPDMLIGDAHTITTKLDSRITSEVQSLFPALEGIEIVSHLEPAGLKLKKHSHPIHHELPPNLKELLVETIHEMDDVGAIKDHLVQQEPDGIHLALTLLLDPEKSVWEVHGITKRVENALYLKIPTLRRCTIHVEPLP